MTPRKPTNLTAALAVMALIVASGCTKDTTGLALAPFDEDPTVEIGAKGIDFLAFSGTNQAGGSGLDVDQTGGRDGGPALVVTVPSPTDPAGSFAGGVLAAPAPRDLSGYNALTFWARASRGVILDVVGFGDDNTGTSRFPATTGALPLTTAWRKYIVPIPLASKLVEERGLFTIADGADGGVGYDIWLDDIMFENLATITDPRPSMDAQTLSVTVGDQSAVEGTQVVFDVGGSSGSVVSAVNSSSSFAPDVTVNAAPGYFTFSSSDETVATVAADGTIQVVGEGTAEITAMLGSTAVVGSVTINAGLEVVPTAAAPTPTLAATDVISLFSNAYTNVTVDTWSATWDMADVQDVQVAGDDTKKYTNLSFAGIEFVSAPVDASAMNAFHIDIWTADPTSSGQVFKVKLVNAGADGDILTTGDNSEHELTFSSGSTPPLASTSWVSLDIPLSAFSGMTGTNAIAQMIISGDPNTVFVDNVYFHNQAGSGGGGGGGGGATPTVAAPTPTQAAGDVISMFSNAYTNVTVDTWSASWDQADVADVQVAGNDNKLYTNLVFAGIETVASPIDASSMTHFRMDIWTPDPVAAPVSFNIKLVDAGADGQIGTAGDNSEHQLVFNTSSTPALAQGSWVSFDIPLTDFTGLTGTGAIAQLIIDGVDILNTVYVDNVYFYNSAGGGGGGGGGATPTVAAPTPTEAAGDVISMFSNAYTNVTVDTWSAAWDNADVADVQVAGDDNKLYTNLTFAGIEMVSAPIDASGMTHFSMDIWTPDPVAAPVSFNIKLVDAGADGQIGTAGDNSEHQLVFNTSSTPALMQGSWVSFDIPLTDFTGLTGTSAIAQLIIDGVDVLNTVYVDNVYFYNAGGGGGGGGGGTGVIDFESGGLGASWTWGVFENVDNPPLQFVANPSQTGVNTSATVAMFTARMAGQPHAGTITTDYPTFTLDATNAVVKIMVYKSFVSDVGIKFENGTQGSTGEIKVANTLTNQWEELTFDFSGVIGDPNNTDITGLIVFPDFAGGRAADNVVYFDNISFNATGGGGGGGGATEPTVAAPTPTQAAGDVISMFSNAYTNVTVDTWSAAWDNADVADVQVAGDDNKLYTNLTFAGIEMVSAPIDASGMTHFSMDIWTPDPVAAPVSFNIKLVDAGADGQIGTAGDNSEHQLVFNTSSTPALMQGSWVSFDIPLTDFTGLTGTSAIAQLIIDGVDVLNTVYVDNVYFYNAGGGGGGGGGGTGVIDFESGGLGASWTWGVFENVDNPPLQFVANPSQTGVNTSATVAMFTARMAGQPHAGTITTDYPTFTLDATNAVVKIMVYKSFVSDVGIKFENGTQGSTGEIKVANTLTNQWEELTFDFSGVIGDPNNTDITGLIVFPDFAGGRAADNVVYFDNISFNATGGGGGGGGATEPSVAAPDPTQAAGDVISMFSNVYTDVTVDRWSTDWDQTDLADVQVAGNDTKLYTNLVFAGIETTSAPIDASGMTHFRMDIWTPDANTAPAGFNIKLVDAGADGQIGTAGDNSEHQLVFNATTTPALMQGQWISFDIPLTDFTGLTGTGAIAQLIIDGVNDINTVYVDNVYFYNSAGGGGGGGGGGSGGIDFEPGGLGASWTWNVFENVDNPPLQFVANPSATGLNTSATVAMFTARMAGQPHAGTITLDSPTFTLDATNAVVRIMVYKSFVSDVGIKFENGTFGSTGEIKVANTLTNQWEELTFDFSGVIGNPNNTDITGLIVFPDFQGGRTTDNIAYFDNISFNAVP